MSERTRGRIFISVSGEYAVKVPQQSYALNEVLEKPNESDCQ
jgi:hypothetical protein